MIGTKVFSRWLKKLSQPTRPIRRTSKLGMEVLEARDVPANFNVTSIADDGSVGTLRWAINQADAGSGNTITITPTATGQLTLTAALPTITAPMTITDNSGGVFSISGVDTYQIFVIDQPTTLNNLKLTKGSGSDGGAVSASAAVTMNSCSITFSTASNFGGGLFSSGGGVTITNSIFDHNSAGGNGGGIELTGGDLSLSGSTVSFNRAPGGAGVNAGSGNVTISGHTSVTSNSATAGGAAGIGAGQNVSVISSYVNHNKGTGVGGGIYAAHGNVTVTANSQVDDNSAGATGGGIWNQSGSAVHVTASDVSGNKASSGGGIFTGAGTVTVTGSTVDDNAARSGSGGGIWAHGNVMVNGIESVITGSPVHDQSASVSHNTATGAGGGIYSNSGSVTIEPLGHVDSNTASSSGGGIWAAHTVSVNATKSTTSHGETDLNSASVNSNTAHGNGGGIYSAGGSVTVTLGTVNYNQALAGRGEEGDALPPNGVGGGSGGSGGGIYAASGNVRVSQSGQTSYNTAHANGGGIFTASGTVTITGNQTSVSNNYAGTNGGGIDANGVVTIENSAAVQSNSAEVGAGGGVYGVTGTVSVKNSASVSNNHAGTNGGGLFAAHGLVQVISSASVDSNHAGSSGGGVYDAAANVVVFNTASVDSNHAGTNGGGIYAAVGTVSVGFNGSADSNTASNGAGGGVYDVANSVGVFYGGSVNSNHAATNAGGIYAGAGNVVVEYNGSVHTNQATAGSGGGVYAAGGNVTLNYGGSVSHNLASAHGGGILVGAGNVTVQHESAVSDNHATGAGGGIWEAATASTKGVNVTSSTVAGNGSGSSGGGIFISQGSATILNSTLSGNTAAGTYGGGIVGEDSKGTITVTQSTISGNSAGTYGGGIASGNTATINNSTIVLNSVGNSGAGGGVAALGGITINNTIVAGNFAGTTATPADVVGTATGSNNVIGNAATAGGLKDRTVDLLHANYVGINGVGTRPVDTIVNPALTNNGGPTLTHALVFASVADGSGDSTLNPATVGNFDQRGDAFYPGFPRTINNLMDVGAVQGTTSFGLVITVGNTVKVFAPDTTATLLTTLTPFGSAVKSVRVAIGDVTGDGLPDLVVAAGAGGGQIKVYDGTTDKVVKTITPYGTGYSAGLYVAVGDVVTPFAAANDSLPSSSNEDIVVGPGGPAEPVEVIDSGTGLPVPGYTFAPFPKKFPGEKYSGGVRVAVGDVFGEGHDQVIVGTGSPQAAYVEVWDYNASIKKMVPLEQFAPAGITGNGLYLASADLNGDGYAEIIIGSGVVSGTTRSALRVFDFHDSKVYGLPAGSTVFSNASNSEEVRVAARNVDGRRDENGNLLNEVVVATGAGPTQQVRVYEATGTSLVLLETYTPGLLGLPAKYAAGMFVA